MREVLGLRARGVEVHTATVRRAGASELMAVDRPEADRTHALLPASPIRLLRAHLRAFGRDWLATLVEALRDSARLAPRELVWQLAYFSEAVLLLEWMRERGVEHLHAHHGNVGSDVAMIACRLGNRRGGSFSWSYTPHGPTEYADVRGHKLALKTARADATVAISDFARSQLMALVDPLHWERISVVHCGVDPAAYSASRAGSSGPLRILNVARMDWRKGQELLVEAVSMLRTPVQLTIVGDGPARAHVEQRARELGVSVNFAGAVGQDEMPSYYAAADVFCLPSFAEGVPVVLMEAMASGVPVVATRIAGVPELVEDEVGGLLVPPGRADALATALERLAGDESLRAGLAAAGRAKVRAEFDIAASVAALEELFRAARATRSRAARP
jgi:glycosyltransferase involved in cell wall biosynthesis